MHWRTTVFAVSVTACINSNEASKICRTNNDCSATDVCLQVFNEACWCHAATAGKVQCKILSYHVQRNDSSNRTGEQTSTSSVSPLKTDRSAHGPTNLETASQHFGLSVSAFIFIFIVLPVMCCICWCVACGCYCTLRMGAERISEISQSTRLVRLRQGLRYIAGCDPLRTAEEAICTKHNVLIMPRRTKSAM